MASTTSDQKLIIDSAIQLLRYKQLNNKDGIVELSEVLNYLKTTDNFYFNRTASNIEELAKILQNNSKLHFDQVKKIFTFKNKFYGAEDLINKLCKYKIGVVENNDLYDDISKSEIDKLKEGNVLREILVKDKAHKNGINILFPNDSFDPYLSDKKYNERTSDFLKNEWQNNNPKLKDNDGNIILFKPSIIKGNNKKIKKNKILKREDNYYQWKNNHIINNIEDAFKQLKNKKI